MDIVFLVILLALIFVPSYLMMRRQRRQQAELQTMQDNLSVGDHVITSAGIHGTIVSLTETSAQLEVSRGVEMTFERIAILRSVTANQPEPVIGEGVDTEVEGSTRASGDGVLDEGSRLDDRGNDHPENLR